MSQTHVDVFIEVKRRFAEQAPWALPEGGMSWGIPQDDKPAYSTSPFICDQIHNIIDPCNSNDPLAVEMTRHINRLLAGHYSVVDWLYKHGHIARDSDKQHRTAAVMEYRRRWVDQLIIDAKDW